MVLVKGGVYMKESVYVGVKHVISIIYKKKSLNDFGMAGETLKSHSPEICPGKHIYRVDDKISDG